MIFPVYIQNWLFYQGEGSIPLAILIFEQFIHLTQITLRPNVQLLNNRQSAYQSFLSPGSIPFAILWHTG